MRSILAIYPSFYSTLRVPSLHKCMIHECRSIQTCETMQMHTHSKLIVVNILLFSGTIQFRASSVRLVRFEEVATSYQKRVNLTRARRCMHKNDTRTGNSSRWLLDLAQNARKRRLSRKHSMTWLMANMLICDANDPVKRAYEWM